MYFHHGYHGRFLNRDSQFEMRKSAAVLLLAGDHGIRPGDRCTCASTSACDRLWSIYWGTQPEPAHLAVAGERRRRRRDRAAPADDRDRHAGHHRHASSTSLARPAST